MRKIKGFTLIELLIVVAIIAILAAIAIPNFLAAQVRAKVARAKGEMRSLATANEAYYVDNNMYAWYVMTPTIFKAKNSDRLAELTTPVSYMSSVPKPDPFGNDQYDPANYDTYDYVDEASIIRLFNGNLTTAKSIWGGNTWGRAYRLTSSGPDRWETYARNFNGGLNYPSPGGPSYYDPSNGTVSNGDIVRFGGTGELTYEDKIIGAIQDN